MSFKIGVHASLLIHVSAYCCDLLIVITLVLLWLGDRKGIRKVNRRDKLLKITFYVSSVKKLKCGLEPFGPTQSICVCFQHCM